MEMTEQRRGPGRPPKTRADEEKRERRRKRGKTAYTGIKLSVDESKLDRENYAYRWVKDYGGRMSQLHGDDWDVAPEQAVIGNEGSGTVGSKIGGTDENGKAYSMVLMRKPRDWYDEDQREKQAPLDAIDEEIRSGRPIKGTELAGDGVYTPDGGNKLS